MAFTFFFRDLHTIEHVVRIMVPEVSGRSKIKVWDAGCAMGPEPYTLAIVLAENMGNFSFKNLIITATDIDECDTFGNIIKEGAYSEEETKRIPPEIFSRYFEKNDGNGFRLVNSIRDRVRFQKHDLLTLQPAGTDYSLILCKNVLLHFRQEERIEVIKMFHNSLIPGGLVAWEQTQKLPEELSEMFAQVVSDAQIYRKI